MTIWPSNHTRQSLAILCALTLAFPPAYGWPQDNPAPADSQQQKPLAPQELDSLVAPVALYPDPLLSQVLVAATYPLEIVEAGRWLKQNSNLKGKELASAAAKQTWDASVQALVAFPDLLKQLDTSISWTTDLGNAFLAQQADVMEAVQRLRKKAKQNGKLESTQQQKVTTATENNTTYVEIQPANPQVIYVPQYNPTVIWGAPPAYYPYPPVVYPPVSTGAVVAAGAISFGVGMAIGAMWSGGGGWGWNCGWGQNSVHVNNTFINNNHFNRTNVGSGNTWRHNSAHRQGVPYANRNVSNRYGGANANRTQRPTASQTQQRLGQANRQAGAGNAGQRQPGPEQRNQGSAQRGQGSRESAQRSQAANRNPAGDSRVGNRQVGGGNSGGGGRSAFGDMHQGGGRANMNAGRGSASMGGSRGGGSRGGGRRR